MNIEECQKQILEALSQMIVYHLKNAQQEQYCPGPDPDRMDATIEFHLSTAKKLRKIRDEFEEVSTGVLNLDY